MNLKKVLFISMLLFGLNYAIADDITSKEYAEQLKTISADIAKNDKLINYTCANIDDLELTYYEANKNAPDIEDKIKQYGEIRTFCEGFEQAKQKEQANVQ